MAKKPKLCQIVAIVSGMKTANQAGLTKAHHIKAESITGLTRKYEPKDAEGDPLAPDVKQRPDDRARTSSRRSRPR